MAELLNLRTGMEDSSQNDDVNHPSHYTRGGIECIKAIEASMTPEEYVGYLKACIMKYVWRYRDKEDPLKDLKKARWYLNTLIEYVEKTIEGVE